MNEIDIKQYIYKYDVCFFNEMHLEFPKVIFQEHVKNQPVRLPH